MEASIGVDRGLYWGCVGRMGNEMETAILCRVLQGTSS